MAYCKFICWVLKRDNPQHIKFWVSESVFLVRHGSWEQPWWGIYSQHQEGRKILFSRTVLNTKYSHCFSNTLTGLWKGILTQGPRQLHSWKVLYFCGIYHNNLLFLLSACRQSSRWTLTKGLYMRGTQSTLLPHLRLFMWTFSIPLDLALFWSATTFTRSSL